MTQWPTHISFEFGGKYKWRLKKALACQVDIPGEIDHPFYSLLGEVLTAKAGYEWDGASGPALDTANFMAASCIHDLLYQLMREPLEVIDRKKYRKKADQIMKNICMANGMSRIRAWWVYTGVRIGARQSSIKVDGRD